MRRGWTVMVAAAWLAGCGDETMPPTGDTYYCRYVNPFSQADECKGYTGEEWTLETATENCDAVFRNTAGAISTMPCAPEGAVGTCRVDGGRPNENITWSYGGDIGVLRTACESFAMGTFTEGGDVQPTQPQGEVMAEALDAMRSGNGVTVSPECVDDACLAPIVEARGAITFAPSDRTANVGIVLYPGALVDPRAYAPLLRALALEGFFVAVVPMPGYSALGGIDRINDVIAANPAVSTWFLGGHSLGGVAAARFADDNPSSIRGLFFWASYPAPDDELVDVPFAITSIFGDRDGLTSVSEINEARPLLPAATTYVELDGGNHAQFGWYGDQRGDMTPYLAREHQTELIVAATAHFVRRALAGGGSDHPGFAQSTELLSQLCTQAQREVAGFDLATLPPSDIRTSDFIDLRMFAEAKPAYTESAPFVIVPQHRRLTGNRSVIAAPPVAVGELWCKLGDAQRLAMRLNRTPTQAPGSCGAVNERVLAWALERLSPSERQAYEALNLEVTFAADRAFGTGAEWIGDGEVEVQTNGTSATVTSPTLPVALDNMSVPEDARGVYYCKVWAPEAALTWVLGQIAR